jgi:hypothetical protein
MELCITNSFHKEKLEASISVQMFYDVYKKMFTKMTGDWSFHHNNDSSHSDLSVEEFLANYSMSCCPQPLVTPHI